MELMANEGCCMSKWELNLTYKRKWENARNGGHTFLVSLKTRTSFSAAIFANGYAS